MVFCLSVQKSCAPQKVDPALIARVRPTIVGCFWSGFFFADHRPSGRGKLDSNGTARVGGGHRGATEIVRSLESTLRAAAVSPNGGARRAAAEERHSREPARDEP